MTVPAVELQGPRWLVLILDGVRPEDITEEHTPNLLELTDGPWAELVGANEPTRVEQFFAALPTESVRAHGLQLDRRSFAIRPGWQSDRVVVDSMSYRPTGRADATTLWLRDAGRAAAECGLGSDGHRIALEELDADVLRAAQMMRHGDQRPTVAALLTAPPIEVHRTFDLADAMRRTLPRKIAKRIRASIAPNHARVRCDSMHELEHCAHALVRDPFCNHGSVLNTEELDRLDLARRANELVFVPHQGVALGNRRTAAAPRLEASGERACAPWITDATESVTVAEFASEFANRAVAQLREIEHAKTDLRRAIEDFPDLLHVLDHDVQHALAMAARQLSE